ncbi:hypothetical protein [Mycolicibacterium palauense]|uniref:hypothetical protein n=1 Tax=Mycolicibacterium palauense TaxID=2034511 RepID=UPI0011457C0F|nr:hypothetical protein [Mycolicibacterium palauense]
MPLLFRHDLEVSHISNLLVLELILLGGMVLLARAISDGPVRARLIDVLIFFALASAAIAFLQRFGVLGPLGRNLWGHAGLPSGQLRGAGFLPDPNFLAVLLAGVIPLIASWRLSHLRLISLVVVAMGLYSTNSRAGIFLAVLALLLTVVVKRAPTRMQSKSRRNRSVAIAAAVLIGLFVLNVGGQRDRVLEAMFVEAGISQSFAGVTPTDTFVAHERRRLLVSWLDLSVSNLPIGAGSVPRNDQLKAAHNTFVTLVAEGGIVGILVVLTTLACVVVFVRRLAEPFAILGIVVVLGGMFLSYPGGSVLLVLPMGLADGILAAGLGRRNGAGTASPQMSGRRPEDSGGRPLGAKVDGRERTMSF